MKARSIDHHGSSAHGDAVLRSAPEIRNGWTACIGWGRLGASAVLFLWILCFGVVQALAQNVVDPSFVPALPTNSHSQAFAIQPDGKVLVSTGSAVLRLNTDGSMDAAFNFSGTDFVGSISLQQDGRILIVSGDQIVRLNTNGTVDGTFSPDLGGASVISSLAAQPDGRILVAGQGIIGADATNTCLIRLNANGSIDSTFAGPGHAFFTHCNSGSFINNVGTMAVRADGKILVGGIFCNATDPTCGTYSSLLRLNAADGSLDTDLSAVVNFGGVGVIALTSQPDNTVLVSGQTADASTTTLVRLMADDTLDTSFNSPSILGSGLYGFYTLFAQPDGRIVVGGQFTSINGQPHNNIARLNANGSNDTTFDPTGGGVNGVVNSLAAQTDGRILVGGNFTVVGAGAQATDEPGLARLLVPDPATQQLGFGTDETSVQWQRSGSSMEFNYVTFESSSDGNTWTPLGNGVWNAGTWSLGGLSFPTGDLWLQASGYDASGTSSGNIVGAGFSGSVLESAQQLVATVTPGAGAGGSIAPSLPQFVATGATTSFTITPDAGQQVLVIGGTCRGALVGTTYTTNPISADCTVTVSFTASINFIATPSASTGGSILPDTPQSAAPGATLTFTLAATPGYLIDSVGGTCGGTLDGTTYTTSSITQNCTVLANFATVPPLTVTSSVSGGNGTVAPATQSVSYGTVATLTVTPDFGYNANVTGCGGSLNFGIYTTAQITANCEVTATFTSILGDVSGSSTTLLIDDSVTDFDCSNAQANTVIVNEGDYVVFCASFANSSGNTLSSLYFNTSWSGLPGVSGSSLGWYENQDMTSGTTFPLSVVKGGYFFHPTTVTETFVGLSEAQLPAYTLDDSVAFNWNELSTSATAVQLPINPLLPEGDAHVVMPFPIYFFGYPTDQNLCISKNGEIRFIYGVSCAQPLDGTVPFSIVPAQQAPFLGIGYLPYIGGSVYYDTQGVAPNRQAIVEWSQMGISPSFDGIAGNPITFEAIIDEASGAITFQYLSMDTGDPLTANGALAVAELWAGAPVNVYSDDQPTLTAGKAVRFTPGAQPFMTVATSTAQIEIATPDATVVPSLLAETVTVGTSAEATLTIGNQGNSPLAWNIEDSTGLTGAHIRTPYLTAAQTPAARAASTLWKAAAPNTARAAAQQTHRGTVAKNQGPTKATPATVDGTAVPAYVIGTIDVSDFGGYFASLNVLAPETLTLDNPANSSSVPFLPVAVGAFIDNDFSHEYTASNDFNYNNDNPATFGYVLTADGSVSTFNSGPRIEPYVPGSSSYEFWAGMRWDYTTHTLYGIATNAGAGDSPLAGGGPDCGGGAPPLCRGDLFTIDPTTGVGTWIAQIDQVDPVNGTAIADFAIAPNGDLYALSMSDDTFYIIDKTTAHVRPIGPSGLTVGYWPAQSMDFDQTTGVLYYATFPSGNTLSGIYTVNLNTGSATLVGPTLDPYYGDAAIVRGLAIAKTGGPCADASTIPWLSFDVTSGSIDPNGITNVSVAFNASGLASGVYHATVCVNSNTQFDSTIAVPVTFTVSALTDTIFANGFELN